MKRRIKRRYFPLPRTETHKALHRLARGRRFRKVPYIEYYLGYIKFERGVDIVMTPRWLRYRMLTRTLRRLKGGNAVIRNRNKIFNSR